MGAIEDINVQLAREFLAMITTDGAAAIEKFLAADGTYIIPGSLPICGAHTKPAIKEMLAGLLGAFATPPAVTITGTTAQGNRVALETTSLGTLLDGRQYANTYHFLFEVENGQFTTVKEYTDTHRVYELFFAPAVAG